MTRVLFALVLVACSKGGGEDPPQADKMPPEAEIKQGREACVDYVKRTCTCAEKATGDKAAEMQKLCAGAKMLVESIDLVQDVGPKMDKERDARQAAATIRKTAKTCIENAAKLLGGCP